MHRFCCTSRSRIRIALQLATAAAGEHFIAFLKIQIAIASIRSVSKSTFLNKYQIYVQHAGKN